MTCISVNAVRSLVLRSEICSNNFSGYRYLIGGCWLHTRAQLLGGGREKGTLIQVQRQRINFRLLKRKLYTTTTQMAFQVNDDGVAIYRNLARLPSVKSGQISNVDIPSHIQINSVWHQRNLERGEIVKYSRGHIVQLDVVVETPPSVLSNELWNKESPSGKYRAVVRKWTDKKGEEKQFVEIWSTTNQLQNIDIGSLDRHGKIYECDGQFGCLEWSHSETHLLYVAEKKTPKTKAFFDAKKLDEPAGSDVPAGDEFLYKPNWGEQMTEKSHPVLCVLDIEAGSVSLLKNLPNDVSPGQAIWCPDDLGVVCVGWWHAPYRLGLIYCINRRSALFHIDLKTFSCNILGDANRSVRSPSFSPDQTKLVFLENAIGGGHRQCSCLMMCDWSTKGIVPVIEIVQQASGDEFPGLFVDALPERCWTADSKRLVVTTAWKSKQELISIEVESGKVSRLTDDPTVGSWSLLDIRNDLLLAACSSINQPQYLVIGQLPAAGKESQLKWTVIDTRPPALAGIEWKIMSVRAPPSGKDSADECLDYEYILLQPIGVTKPPLINYCHGGPHSTFSADFQLYISALCLLGYAVLLVNYRGSYGFGQRNIESIFGKIGSQDVQDVQRVVDSLVHADIVDKDRITVIGGSHGGFLTAHLIGQYPDFYKAAIARNPVLNIASMLGTTDIIDWVYVESGIPFDMKSELNGEIYEKLFKLSPIAHVDKMKTPLMLMIGGKDLRVPPSQSFELKKHLEARGQSVRLLLYPDCSHPLSEVRSEADAFVNIVKWINEHINNPTKP